MNDEPKMLENPDIRYLLRQRTHSLGLHGEIADSLKDEITGCLDGKACNYDRLIGTLEFFIDTARKAIDDAAVILNILRLARMVEK